jgi:hypothetical protein
MKAIFMADQDLRPSVSQSLERLDQERQAGWNGFARFLTVTLIGVTIVLLIIAAFTVWS